MMGSGLGCLIGGGVVKRTSGLKSNCALYESIVPSKD